MDVLGVSPNAQCHCRLQEQIDPLTFRLGYDRYLEKPPTPLSTAYLPPLVDWSLFPPAHWCPNPEPLWHPNNTTTFILKQVCDFTLTSKEKKKLSLHLGHQLSVFSVDSGNGTDVLTGLQSLVELWIPQHHHVFVGHEHLEGVHSMFPHQGLHLIKYLRTIQRSQGQQSCICITVQCMQSFSLYM